MTAVPTTVDAFLQPYIEVASEGFEVHIASSAVGRLAAEWHTVKINREIAVQNDLRALHSLQHLLRLLRPGVVHSVTPKAGILAMTSAMLADVPNRVHTFTGQVWATRSGATRQLLKTIDTMTSRLATHPLVDSWSQRSFLVDEGVLRPGTGAVLGFGSMSGAEGLDVPQSKRVRNRVRHELGIGGDDVLVLYVGRLARDKGVIDLARAFASAHGRRPNLRLLLAGPDEGGLASQLRGILSPAGGASSVRPEFVSEPQRLMRAADIFCMPSYREGFGTAVVEAAACGLPSVTTDIYGLADAVEPGRTGLVVPISSPDQIARALVQLAEDPSLRIRMGCAAAERVQLLFDPGLVRQAVKNLYGSMT